MNSTKSPQAGERTQPQFTATKLEMDMIRKIVKRAQCIDPEYQTMDATMDIEAAHCSGNPLDLAKLLAADDMNLAHDVFGIRRHIDRETGKLTGCFSPRCSI